MPKIKNTETSVLTRRLRYIIDVEEIRIFSANGNILISTLYGLRAHVFYYTVTSAPNKMVYNVLSRLIK